MSLCFCFPQPLLGYEIKICFARCNLHFPIFVYSSIPIDERELRGERGSAFHVERLSPQVPLEIVSTRAEKSSLSFTSNSRVLSPSSDKF
jgi:hypothetical protein